MKLIIGFSRAKAWWAIGSKTIQLVEKRPYSHAYVRFAHPITKIDMVIQASHGMVHQINFDLFKEHNEVVKEYEFEISWDNYKTLLAFLHQNLGKKYSRAQLVWVGILKVCHVKVKWRNWDKEFDCSELGARICETVGILNTSDEDLITPSDLDNMLSKKITS